MHDLGHYPFLQHYLYTNEDTDCPPPYTDYSNDNCERMSESESQPLMLQCLIGLIPYACTTYSNSIEEDFSGY